MLEQKGGQCHWEFTRLPGARPSGLGIPAWPSVRAGPPSSPVSPPSLGFLVGKMGLTLSASHGRKTQQR